jgi:biotin synthase
MGCRFCSFASQWTQFREPHELSVEESLKWADYFIDQRADYLILRTSERYCLEKFLDLGRRIANHKPDTVRLIANTRLANDSQLAELKKAGFHGIYKTIRLREGVDTAFDPADRLEQIRHAHEQGLRVFGLIEPVGPEHSDEEIVDAMLALRDEVHTGLVGAMARVPVVGSPLYGFGAVDAQRLAGITAVFILAMGDCFGDVEVVCSHPPHAEILRAGASAVVVEVGAIPRDTTFAQTEWRGLTMSEAKNLLRETGYDV